MATIEIKSKSVFKIFHQVMDCLAENLKYPLKIIVEVVRFPNKENGSLTLESG